MAASAGGAGLPELGRCTAVTPVKEGSKTVYHGAYTTRNATKPAPQESASTNGPPVQDRPKHFSAALAGTTLETVGKAKVKCAAGSSTGEFTGARSQTTSLILTGCELASPKATCQTESAAAGEVRTSTLEGQLGFISKGSKPSVGIDLKPSGSSIATFACGATKVTVNGSVIAPVTALDKMGTAFKVKLKASKGVQAPEQIEGGVKDTLGWTASPKPEEQLGLTATETLTSEEPLEIKGL